MVSPLLHDPHDGDPILLPVLVGLDIMVSSELGGVIFL